MRVLFAAIAALSICAQEQDAKARMKAVVALIETGGPQSLEALTPYLADPDAGVQRTAVDGLVNFYLPGYYKLGWRGRFQKATGAVTDRFTGGDDPVVPSYVTVRPEIVSGIAKVAADTASMETKAAACRALGVLRAGAASETLLGALATKNTAVLYEVMTAFEKIRNPAVAPKLFYLLRDPDEKVQIAAIQTVSLLGNKDAIEPLREAWTRTKNDRVRRALMEAFALLPEESNRALFDQHVMSNDDMLRAGAAEGLGRLKAKDDLARLKTLFEGERKIRPRLSLSYAVVNLGHTEISELSPLQYLINTLNHKAWRGVALGFLKELTRDASVRFAVHSAALQATRDEKLGIAEILGHAGAKDSIEVLEALSKDKDTEVSAEALRALRVLRAQI